MRKQLNGVIQEHARFLNIIPGFLELHSACLLLNHCAAPRTNYYPRFLQPSISRELAHLSNENLKGCLSRLIGIGIASDDPAAVIAQLPLRLGGLGIRSAQRTAPAAYWASFFFFCLHTLRVCTLRESYANSKSPARLQKEDAHASSPC